MPFRWPVFFFPIRDAVGSRRGGEDFSFTPFSVGVVHSNRCARETAGGGLGETRELTAAARADDAPVGDVVVRRAQSVKAAE